jgi:hypothetical protein
LTNISIINFSFIDFNDIESLKDLENKINMIKNSDPEIFIILLVRDAIKTEHFQGDLVNFAKNKECKALL